MEHMFDKIKRRSRIMKYGREGPNGCLERGSSWGQERGGGRISRDEMFMEMARTLAKRSTCVRGKVGALIVNGGRIVSCGYNGPVSGAPECGEAGGCLGAGCDRSIHAELNSILFAARAGISVDGCTLYCTLAPCLKCAQAIVNAGIGRVVYGEDYRRSEGVEFLAENMVQVVRARVETGRREGHKWIVVPGGWKCPVCGHTVNSTPRGTCPYCFAPVE